MTKVHSTCGTPIWKNLGAIFQESQKGVFFRCWGANHMERTNAIPMATVSSAVNNWDAIT